MSIVKHLLDHQALNVPDITQVTNLISSSVTVDFIFEEPLSGLIDSSNRIFTTANNFVIGKIVLMTYAGKGLTDTGLTPEYSRTGSNQITLNFTPTDERDRPIAKIYIKA